MPKPNLKDFDFDSLLDSPPAEHKESTREKTTGDSVTYAVCIIAYLRENPSKIGATDLLATLSIPAKFGVKVITRLGQDGMLQVDRGRGGGVRLALARPIPVNSIRRLFGQATFRFTEI